MLQQAAALRNGTYFSVATPPLLDLISSSPEHATAALLLHLPANAGLDVFPLSTPSLRI